MAAVVAGDAFLAQALAELRRRHEGELFYRMYPDDGPFARDRYAKHVEFFDLGATKPYRCLIGGNGVGKSLAGAYETTAHVTGLYRDWWQGKRYTKPIVNWTAGVDFKSLRESLQLTLFGRRGQEGTGMIPRECLVDVRYSNHDVVDFATIRHFTDGREDGISRLVMKCYEQGREAFQAANVDDIGLDEEPADAAIFTECVQRFRGETAGGHIRMTFTPLFGASEVVSLFVPQYWPPEYSEDDHAKSGRAHVACSIDDVPHFTDEERERKLANTPPHERGPRLRGEVSVGRGLVYPFSEDEFSVDPLRSGLPRHWPRLYALDPGLRVTAALWGAHDPDTDTVYVYSEHYMPEELPAVHAQAIKARGVWIPGLIDPAGKQRNQVTGEAPMEVYRELGLRLKEADNEVHDGIFDVYQRFSTGRLKIYRTCTNLLRELRMYSRDEKNKIVKRDDHACDCLRYLCRGLKHAMLPHEAVTPRRVPRMAEETFGVYG